MSEKIDIFFTKISKEPVIDDVFYMHKPNFNNIDFNFKLSSIDHENLYTCENHIFNKTIAKNIKTDLFIIWQDYCIEPINMILGIDNDSNKVCLYRKEFEFEYAILDNSKDFYRKTKKCICILYSKHLNLLEEINNEKDWKFGETRGFVLNYN